MIHCKRRWTSGNSMFWYIAYAFFSFRWRYLSDDNYSGCDVLYARVPEFYLKRAILRPRPYTLLTFEERDPSNLSAGKMKYCAPVGSTISWIQMSALLAKPLSKLLHKTNSRHSLAPTIYAASLKRSPWNWYSCEKDQQGLGLPPFVSVFAQWTNVGSDYNTESNLRAWKKERIPEVVAQI